SLVEVPVAYAKQIENSIQPEMRHRVPSALTHQRLGMKSDAHAGDVQHGKIICAIAYSNRLIERNVLPLRNLRQKLRFLRSVHNFARDLARNRAVHDFQLICEHVVNAEALLEMLPEKRESARKYCSLVTKNLQRRDQAFGAIRQGHRMQHFLQALF